MRLTEHMGDTIRYGVIGTGMMGVEHIENVRALGRDADVTAIADPNTDIDRRGTTRPRHRDHRVRRPSRPARRGLCDAVVVATPNHTHIDVVSDVLATDLHVMIEKPLCTTVADCERVLELEAPVGPVRSRGWRWSTATWPLRPNWSRLVHDGIVGTAPDGGDSRAPVPVPRRRSTTGTASAPTPVARWWRRPATSST